MEDSNIITQNFEFTCIECQNLNTIDNNKGEGDIIECGFCGIEYDIDEVTTDGQYILVLLEEEK